jgi:hypothetical protein
MNQEEREAFLDAYENNVGHLPRNLVEDFVTRYEAGEDIDYSSEHTATMDALGVWHEGVKYAIKKYAIKAI